MASNKTLICIFSSIILVMMIVITPLGMTILNAIMPENYFSEKIPKSLHIQVIKICDGNYKYACIPLSDEDLDCEDIPFTNFRVYPPDPHGFDEDGDKVGCKVIVDPYPWWPF